MSVFQRFRFAQARARLAGTSKKSPRTGTNFRRQLICESLEERSLLAADSSISSFVWNDANANGIQDPSEPGIPGAVAELFSTGDATVGGGDDASLGVAITDAQGRLEFDGLADGVNYYLVFRAPVGDPAFSFATQGAGLDPALDSDVSSVGVTSVFTLGTDEARTDIDAGLVGNLPGFGFALGIDATVRAYGSTVVRDAENNAYLTGSFEGTADFDRGPGTHLITSAGVSEGFLAKYSPTGALVWVRSFGSDSALGDVVLGPAGSIYLSGTFGVDPRASDPRPPGTPFMARLDADGEIAWLHEATGTGMVSFGDVEIFDGSLYSATRFVGTADVDPGPGELLLTSEGERSIVVRRLDLDGQLIWARQTEGTGSISAYGLAVGASGIHVTGEYIGEIDFDPSETGVALTQPATVRSAFIWKLDLDGNLAWTWEPHGGAQLALDVALDSTGNVYVTGMFLETIDFDPGHGSWQLTSAGGWDGVIARLSGLTGRIEWVQQFGGQESLDEGIDIDFGPDGLLYVSGNFVGSVDFDARPDVTVSRYSNYRTDIFLSALHTDGTLVWVTSFEGDEWDFAGDLEVTSDGSVYLAGTVQNSPIDFDPSSGVFEVGPTTFKADAFLVRYVPPTATVPPFIVPDVTVDEDAANTVIDLAQAFAGRGPNATPIYSIESNSNSGLFTSTSLNAANSTLTLDYAPNANGFSRIWVVADYGQGITVRTKLDVFVNSVNDAPAVIVNNPGRTYEDSGGQVVHNVIQAANAGPANESGQSLTFELTNDNPGMFSVQPAISSDGTLTYTAIGSGTAFVTIVWRDNGGTEHGGIDFVTDAIKITIDNRPPTMLPPPSPLDARFNQPLSFKLKASDPSVADQAANFNFRIDWDGDSDYDTFVTGPTGVLVTRTFTDFVGIHKVNVIVLDQDGTPSQVATFNITVSGVQLVPDRENASLTMLVVSGTMQNDVLKLSPGGGQTVVAKINGVVQGAFQPTGQIIVFGADGKDTITVEAGIGQRHILYGNSGKDKLWAGANGGTLIGGDGDDVLMGSTGRDILIGGLGADTMHGGGEEDILISGLYMFEGVTGNGIEGLARIMREWSSTASLTLRQDRIKGAVLGGQNGTASFQGSTNVYDDGVADSVAGEAGRDWFFANYPGLDLLSDRDSTEKVSLIYRILNGNVHQDFDSLS